MDNLPPTQTSSRINAHAMDMKTCTYFVHMFSIRLDVWVGSLKKNAPTLGEREGISLGGIIQRHIRDDRNHRNSIPRLVALFLYLGIRIFCISFFSLLRRGQVALPPSD